MKRVGRLLDAYIKARKSDEPQPPEMPQRPREVPPELNEEDEEILAEIWSRVGDEPGE